MEPLKHLILLGGVFLAALYPLDSEIVAAFHFAFLLSVAWLAGGRCKNLHSLRISWEPGAWVMASVGL